MNAKNLHAAIKLMIAQRVRASAFADPILYDVNRELNALEEAIGDCASSKTLDEQTAQKQIIRDLVYLVEYLAHPYSHDASHHEEILKRVYYGESKSCLFKDFLFQSLLK